MHNDNLDGNKKENHLNLGTLVNIMVIVFHFLLLTFLFYYAHTLSITNMNYYVNIKNRFITELFVFLIIGLVLISLTRKLLSLSFKTIILIIVVYVMLCLIASIMIINIDYLSHKYYVFFAYTIRYYMLILGELIGIAVLKIFKH